MRDGYATDYVVVDAKNSGKLVKKNDALQIANYLKQHGAGLFGIIMCRIGADAGCMHTLREQWCTHRKMILTINDDELGNMLLARSAGGRAETLLSGKIRRVPGCRSRIGQKGPMARCRAAIPNASSG